jgi:C4-dicarboxylate-specific signal transduction histidine kinase
MRQTKLDEFLELEEQNKELEKLINLEVEKNRQKDKIMFQQNKMAAMGEMLNNIAHQWRQPLMEISSLFIPIQAKIDFDLDIDKKELNQTIIKLNEITKYMSNTIDDFKNFFATTKEKEEFKLSSQINASLNILSSSLKNNNIMLDIIVKKNPTVYINIINNAKDILIQRKIKNPKIIITIDEAEDEVIICVEDNGGGVKVKPIENIFKPFFTYEKMNGTGIGLFMSKLIIENNMNGRLWVENKKDGALFKIITNK